MNDVRIPVGMQLTLLARSHPRKHFRSGQPEVDLWFATKALQHQEKHLSVTKVLLDASGNMAGYYTLASGQVDFSDLPAETVKRLPKRALPVAVLAWLGVSKDYQGQGLGTLLLAQALRDCYEASSALAFIAVVLDCIDDTAKNFYQKRNFMELPGNPYKLFLSADLLEAMLKQT